VPSAIDIFSVKQALSLRLPLQEKFDLVEIFLQSQLNPNLSVIIDELGSVFSAANLQEYYNLIKILIKTSAKPSLKRNIKYIEYLIVKLYQTGE
jgi:hypothetical protein